MPVINRFANCTIKMYADEHPPPHFHVEFSDGMRCSVEIDTLKIIAGAVHLRRRMNEPLTWAAANQGFAVEVEGVDKMNKPPRIQAVEVVAPMALHIAWSTGEHFDLDLSEPIIRLEALAPLRDSSFFAGVQPGEWGHSLVWNDEIDLGADRLYERCKEQAGELSPSKFDAWMKNHQLSLTTAADALGLSRRMIAHYRTGSRPIPKTVSLACKGWEVQTNNSAPVRT